MAVFRETTSAYRTGWSIGLWLLCSSTSHRPGRRRASRVRKLDAGGLPDVLVQRTEVALVGAHQPLDLSAPGASAGLFCSSVMVDPLHELGFGFQRVLNLEA